MIADILWTIYLGILGTSAISFLVKRKYTTYKTKLDFIISVITWFGLFGYVTDLNFFSPFFWKIVFVIGLLWDILFTIFFLHEYEEEEELPLPFRFFGLLIIAPLYYGLFMYAFK
ncbi:hypothetical protein ACFYKX_02760 [Cytobacillus sp. FJAT-54145]|uniref:Uncharacterized protein n=1 Tax=Cytobacillus spartinae TaxID=3299023 RepID=A0ABW6K9C0_9BACI